MSTTSPSPSEYELVLMLDPETPDERRDEIAAETLNRIESSGELKHDRAWGMRKMAYEIDQRTEADYRFYRFTAGAPLLGELDHNLKIADGVLRFRVFRVDPDSPVIEPPPPVALSAAPSRGSGPRRERPGRGDAERPPPAAATAAPAPAEPAATAAEAPAPAASTPAPAEPAAAASTPAPAAPASEAPAAEDAAQGTEPPGEGEPPPAQ